MPKEKRSNFVARAVRCRFLRDSEHKKEYRLEEVKSNRMLVSRDAKFIKDSFSTVGGVTVATTRSLFKVMMKRLIRTSHITTKRTTKMKNSRRRMKLSLESDTNEPNRSKKRLNC